MNVQYLVNQDGHKTGVFLSLEDFDMLMDRGKKTTWVIRFGIKERNQIPQYSQEKGYETNFFSDRSSCFGSETFRS